MRFLSDDITDCSCLAVLVFFLACAACAGRPTAEFDGEEFMAAHADPIAPFEAPIAVRRPALIAPPLFNPLP